MGDVRLGESGRDDDPFGAVTLARVGGYDEVAATSPVAARFARNFDDFCVITDLETMRGCEVGEIAAVVVSLRVVQAGVAREAEVRIVAEQRVPIPAQSELGIVVPGMRLVDRKHLAMPRERRKERSR